jgi:hypothetical protein
MFIKVQFPDKKEVLYDFGNITREEAVSFLEDGGWRELPGISQWVKYVRAKAHFAKICPKLEIKPRVDFPKPLL